MLSILVFLGLVWYAGTMEQLRHCLCAYYGSGLRAAARYHANEAFRLNKHENCKSFKVLKYFDPSEI